MKKIFIICLMAIAIISCNNTPNTFATDSITKLETTDGAKLETEIKYNTTFEYMNPQIKQVKLTKYEAVNKNGEIVKGKKIYTKIFNYYNNSRYDIIDDDEFIAMPIDGYEYNNNFNLAHLMIAHSDSKDIYTNDKNIIVNFYDIWGTILTDELYLTFYNNYGYYGKIIEKDIDNYENWTKIVSEYYSEYDDSNHIDDIDETDPDYYIHYDIYEIIYKKYYNFESKKPSEKKYLFVEREITYYE